MSRAKEEDTILSLGNVSKWFGKTRALNGITFSVRRGEVLCYLGPNGAGKTTTIKIVSGILYPDEGSVSVLGASVPRDVQKVRSKMGIMSAEKTYFAPWYSVEGVLGLYGELYGLEGEVLHNRIEELLDLFKLREHRKKRIYELSLGLKSRACLAKALIHDPHLLLLDEPTSSVDVQAATAIRDYIKKLAEKGGKTVLLTTHNMFEAQQMASRVVIIVKGRIVADGTVDELARTVFSLARLQIKCEKPVEIKKVLEAYGECSQNEDTVVLFISAGANLDEILREAANVGGIRAVNTIQPTLEEIFMKVIEK